VERWPRVRDNAELRVMECRACGLVFLSSQDHITEQFYDEGGMHGGSVDPTRWSHETAADDNRRFEYCRPFLANKRVLDFGFGNGGFLLRARAAAACVAGVDRDSTAADVLQTKGVIIAADLAGVPGTFDVITMFHVLEHMKDPRGVLTALASRLSPGGRLIVEVPNADDALIRLYDVDAFKDFTYWSCHLYLFTASTLSTVFQQVQATSVRIQHVQRYPLSNHLYWLARGKPGGHVQWACLDHRSLTEAYEARLASLGMTDTLLADVRFDTVA
jgi:2-polyprenyl-3-methyl-5-hydroxy-6-metoxy-1,4-benzoquinol methylase